MSSPKSNSGRYRKNVERDEEFIGVTCGLVNKVEWAVKQNMTVDIYEQYFTEQVTQVDLVGYQYIIQGLGHLLA